MIQQQDSVQSNQDVGEDYNSYLQQVRSLPKNHPSTVPPEILQLIKGIKQLKESDIMDKFSLPASKLVPKKVCAKLLKPGDMIVECYNCRFDHSCIVCYQCFQNGNHQGHKFVVRNAGGGCCDCGDKQAWKVQGFCKNHSGTFKQFQIPAKDVKKAEQKLHGLFYTYFYLKLKDNPEFDRFAVCLINYMRKLNNNNVYYNKMITMCLTAKLIYPLNQLLDKCTVLQNILKFVISGVHLAQWFDVFVSMFAYYPFKLALITCYIQRFGEIVDGSEISFKCAGSIACQIITSHQLVQRYCQSNEIGIGQGTIRPTLQSTSSSLKAFLKYYLRMLYDLNYIHKLTGKAPLIYWSMHICSKEGLSNIFAYYDQLYLLAKLLRDNGLGEYSIMVYFIDLVSLEHEIIELFIYLMKIVRTDKALMHIIIKFLWNKCKLFSVLPSRAFIFRPYERCFGLTLFAYFQCSLTDIPQKKRELLKILQLQNGQFNESCFKIMQKVFQTYLFYGKIVSQPGLNQSLYGYSYFYKLKFHMLFSTDVMTLKLLLQLCENKLMVDIKFIAQVNQNSESQKKEKRVYLNNILAFIRYLYMFELNQIYLALEMEDKSSQYNTQIAQFLLRFFNAHKGSVSIQKVNKLIEKLFCGKAEYIQQWIKQNCQINKQKKQLDLIAKENDGKSLNINDIWENTLSQTFQFSDPYKSKQVITGYNKFIFELFWHELTIKSLATNVKHLYEGQNKQGIDLFLSNILPIYVMLEDDSSLAITFKQNVILLNLQKIPLEIRNRIIESSQSMIQISKNKSEQGEQQDKKRRQTQLQLKAKKMQKMKAKQQNFLHNMQMQSEQAIPSTLDLNRKSSQKNCDQSQYADVCCICKNDNPSKFVILVKVEVRNFEKLMKLGPGVNCVTFTSCFHKFDLECILKLEGLKIVNFSLRCPLCKSAASVIMPVDSKNMTDVSMVSVQNQIFTLLLERLPQSEEFDHWAHQQFIRGFYNYFLFCYAGARNCQDKRLKIYQMMVQHCLNTINIKDLLELQQRTIKNYGNEAHKRGMKSYQKKEQQYRLKEKLIQEKMKNQQEESSELDQSKSKRIRQKQKKKAAIVEKQFKKQNNQKQQQSIVISSALQQHVGRRHNLFKIFVNLFFEYLRSRIEENKMKQQSSTKQKQEIESMNQLVPFMHVCIKVLFAQQLTPKQQLILLQWKRSQNLHVIRNLPRRYIELANQKCTECEKISPTTVLCLMCEWVGCQKCENGTLKAHNNEHGGVIACMELRNSQAYYYSDLGVKLIDRLYVNDWGHSLVNNTKWEQFELNSSKLLEIQSTLLQDKPINFIKRQ